MFSGQTRVEAQPIRQHDRPPPGTGHPARGALHQRTRPGGGRAGRQVRSGTTTINATTCSTTSQARASGGRATDVAAEGLRSAGEAPHGRGQSQPIPGPSSRGALPAGVDPLMMHGAGDGSNYGVYPDVPRDVDGNTCYSTARIVFLRGQSEGRCEPDRRARSHIGRLPTRTNNARDVGVAAAAQVRVDDRVDADRVKLTEAPRQPTRRSVERSSRWSSTPGHGIEMDGRLLAP